MATIIGPYPTRDFIEDVISHAPDEVILAVDDGWPQERIEEIRCAFRGSESELTVQRVAPQVGNGLVHAKLYCLEWVNAAGNRHRHTLLAGSANASSPGFGTHAESFVHIDLADIVPAIKKSILQYFTDLGSGHDVSYMYFLVHNKSWLSLPALRIVQTPWPNGFDAWIRRGRLCHSYQPDPAFGRLVLRLKEPMPQGLLGANLGQSGFSIAGETQAFTRAYVSYADFVADESNKQQKWRQRYFTETVYGFWTSAECFKQMESEFVAAQTSGRKSALDTIRHPTPMQRDSWIDDFLRSINSVFSTLTAEQQKTYFHIKHNGELDENRYREQAGIKLGRDRAKATDEYFCSRFASGFAFPPVPALGDEYEEFVLEFCANLLAKLQSRYVRNKLAAILRDKKLAHSDMTPQDLLNLLRDRWSDLHPILTGFFREDTPTSQLQRAIATSW